MALLLAALSPAAKADCTIVSGNVYDVGKYAYSTSTEKPYSDSVLCWAAAASNIIQHWQDTYYDEWADKDLGVPVGAQDTAYSAPTGTGCLNVYNSLLENWSNSSGYAYNAFSWWMQGGQYDPHSGSNLLNEASGGYYKALFGDTPPEFHETGLVTDTCFFDYLMSVGREEQHYTRPSLDNLKTYLGQAFSVQGQAVTLSILSEKTWYSHAISCWGYETDDNGKIVSLIVSDSDDKKYGLTVLNLREGVGADGKVRTYVSTDRHNGFGDETECYINDFAFIQTPGTAAKDAEKSTVLTGDTIGSTIGQTSRIAADTTVRHALALRGDAMNTNSGVPNAIVFTSEQGAKLTIQGGTAASTAPLFHIADGAMALLYGGLDISSGQGAGVLADGHLYIHGGDVTIAGRNSAESGAAIYASQIDGTLSKAQTYAEIRRAGTVNISNNTSTTSKKDSYYIYEAGGGAIAAEDSFAIRDSGNITMTENKADGLSVNGGAAWANFNATISGNGDVDISANALSGSGIRSFGGGVAGYFTELSGNGNVVLDGNSIVLSNANNFNWESNTYYYGARAGGGAVAARFFTLLSTYVANTYFVYTHASLHMDGNNAVSMSGNSVSATYTGYHSAYDETCYAHGGAMFLDGQMKSTEAVGTDASISGNKGNVTLDGNSATSYSVKGNDTARGGAIYIGTGSTLDIKDNQGSISLTNNSVSGTTAQGGAIYNESALSVSGNKEVTFSGNSAKEGNDLYNAEGATAEFAWNGDVSFGSGSANTAAVVNKGTLYLAAEAGKKIEFKDSKLDSSDGKVVLGTDKAGSKSTATGVRFTQGSSAMSITNREAKAAELEKLTISYNLISGASDANPVESILRGVDIVSNDNLCVENVGMAADVSISTGSHAITLSNVVIDLTGTAYTTQDTETGTCYIFDVRNMINCELTMANVKFDASMFDGMQVGNGDCVAVNFGDDVNISNSSNATMVRNVGETEVTISELKLKSGVVYFGAAGADTPEINVPEPATGTFSLLALAALAARRRRR